MASMAFETAELREQLKQFELPNVRFTGEKLGTGSYGSVEVVEIPGALCAAKTLHELLVQSVAHVQRSRRGSRHGGMYVQRSIIDGFVTECTLMSTLRHPHIVQFLGVCYPPGAQLPALVMELLMTSLYNLLLNQSTPDIPVSIKQSLLRDIARGLVFLHDHSVIHRDLTASNVLIDSSLTAKIADLGMARLLNIEAGKQAATMTKGPGNAAYMPPEAKDGAGDLTKYGKPIDTFSMGNLILFTATQECPDPRNPTYFDEKSCTMKARTEKERRINSFQLLEQMYGKDHLFVLLATQCLQDNPRARPTAPEILKCLEKMPVIPYRDWSSSKLELVQRVVNNEHIVSEQEAVRTENARLVSEHQKTLTENARLVSEHQKTLTENARLVSEQQMKEQELKMLRVQETALLEQIEQVKSRLTISDRHSDISPAISTTKQNVSEMPAALPPLSTERDQTEVKRMSDKRDDEFVEAILSIRVGPGQPLQQVQVPAEVYDKAKKFVVQAPNFLSGSEPHRFKVLHRMESGRSIYDLLIDDAANTALKDAEAKIIGWKEASKAILRYALNLLLAPKHPGFQTLKLASSYYVYQVAKKLKGAEEILISMGYQGVTGSQEVQELKYKDEVNNLHVAETARDLVILDGELTRVKGLVSHMYKENHAISLTHILHARAHPTEMLKDALDRATFLASQGSFPPPPVVHHPVANTPMPRYNSPRVNQQPRQQLVQHVLLEQQHKSMQHRHFPKRDVTVPNSKVPTNKTANYDSDYDDFEDVGNVVVDTQVFYENKIERNKQRPVSKEYVKLPLEKKANSFVKTYATQVPAASKRHGYVRKNDFDKHDHEKQKTVERLQALNPVEDFNIVSYITDARSDPVAYGEPIFDSLLLIRSPEHRAQFNKDAEDAWKVDPEPPKYPSYGSDGSWRENHSNPNTSSDSEDIYGSEENSAHGSKTPSMENQNNVSVPKRDVTVPNSKVPTNKTANYDSDYDDFEDVGNVAVDTQDL